MKMLFVCMGAILALGALAGCATDSRSATVDTALVSFQGTTTCSNAAGSPLTSAYTSTARPLLTTDAGLYANLNCISWDATGSSLKVGLVSFRGGCNKWTGEAVVAADNTLELYANHEPEEFEGEMMCGGSCCSGFHDWSYEVKGVDASKDCPTKIAVGLPCEGEYAKRYDTILPLASKKTGIVCRYGEYYEIDKDSGHAGTIDMPCRNQTYDPPPAPCDDGLACTKVTIDGNPDAAICLKACAADADCPLDGLLTCDGGVCRLKETW